MQHIRRSVSCANVFVLHLIAGKVTAVGTWLHAALQHALCVQWSCTSYNRCASVDSTGQVHVNSREHVSRMLGVIAACWLSGLDDVEACCFVLLYDGWSMGRMLRSCFYSRANAAVCFLVCRILLCLLSLLIVEWGLGCLHWQKFLSYSLTLVGGS
jgi:hypothetical protein